MSQSATQAVQAFQIMHGKLAQLQPISVKLSDESHLHVGHKEAGNGAHLKLEIVSDRFRGLTPLQRHRVVYDALGSLSQAGVHALSLKTLTPQEIHE